MHGSWQSTVSEPQFPQLHIKTFPEGDNECKWIKKTRLSIWNKAGCTNAQVPCLVEGKETGSTCNLKCSKAAALCQPPKEHVLSQINR